MFGSCYNCLIVFKIKSTHVQKNMKAANKSPYTAAVKSGSPFYFPLNLKTPHTPVTQTIRQSPNLTSNFSISSIDLTTNNDGRTAHLHHRRRRIIPHRRFRIHHLNLRNLTEISNTSSLPSTARSKSSTSITYLIFFAISLVSFLFILNSLISITDALKSKDQTGVVLQFEVISIAALFFLFSVLGVLTSLRNSFQIPSPILNTLCLFGFVEEFFLFYIQKKDSDGIENRYYDLLLVPIFVCIVSTILELKTLKSNYSRLGRGIGLVLQGMWFVQMGVLFYSSSITDGCFMHEKSRGNFTIRCKGHPEFHRARAIATLQFNCHLAVLVCFIAGVYSLVSRKHGVSNELMQYKPLGAELQHVNHAQFTLDSDDDEDGNGNGKYEGNVVVDKDVSVVTDTVVNGYGSSHH
ncbi:hypothetical protein L1987_71769 [Smallanthus sonchifolius]|uniref:Uncharacterized protein n=1 Tax=Smallanthus sonchifolius TaxID=185202 RepID=A0ACB9ATC7_9ASTR|nr:hypothetical protein L1987_71769 [Smallanthus sonchifolius]